MTAIFRSNDKWIVRDVSGEWEFDTYDEASNKLQECLHNMITTLEEFDKEDHDRRRSSRKNN